MFIDRVGKLLNRLAMLVLSAGLAAELVTCIADLCPKESVIIFRVAKQPSVVARTRYDRHFKHCGKDRLR